MTPDWLHGFVAALCVVFIGGTFGVLWCEAREKRRENDRLERVLRLAERKTGVETPRRVG